MTTRKEMTLPDGPKLRYTPLPALAVADYIDDYIGRLGQTGVFDYLSTAGAGVNLRDVVDFDLSAIGIIGSAFSRMLSTDGGAEKRRLSDIALDHAQRFKVQAKDDEQDDWVDLSTADAFNEYMPPDLLLDFVKQLGGDALRPLWNRLRSPDAAREGESPKLSPESTKES